MTVRILLFCMAVIGVSLVLSGCGHDEPDSHAQSPSSDDVYLVTGIVKDVAGKPVSLARLHLYPETIMLLNGQRFCYTRSDGTFEIQRDPNIVEEVGSSEYLLVWSKDGSQCACARIRRDKQYYEIILEEGISVSGTVRDTGDEPIAGAQVSISLYTPGQIGDIGVNCVSTDAEGNFRVPRVPRGLSYEVSVNSPQHDQRTIAVNLVEPSTSHIELDPLILDDAAMSVSGHVVDSDGRPAPRCRVWATGHPRLYHQTFRETNTDISGLFKIEGLISGPVYLVAVDQFSEDYTRGSVKTIAGDQDVRIVLGVEAPFE